MVDIQNAETSSQPTLYAADVLNAANAITAARGIERQIDALLTDTVIGERVAGAVDGTLQVVNQQALARSPSIDTIEQSGSAFGSFLNLGTQLNSQVAQARSNLNGAAASHADDAIGNSFAAHEYALQAALALVPSLSIDADLAAISACHTEIPAAANITVSPNPVALTGGAAATTLTLTGGAPDYTLVWEGGLPADVTVANGPKITVTAVQSAAAGKYAFHIVDQSGDYSASVPLTVAAAAPAAAPAAAAPAAAAPAAAAKAANPVAGGPPPTPTP